MQRRFLANPAQVGPSSYTRINFPLALLIAFLLAAVPYLTWRDNDWRTLLRRLRWPVRAGAFSLSCADHDWEGMLGEIIVE